MHLLACASASPAHEFTQAQWLEILRSQAGDQLTERSHKLLYRILKGQSGIDTRQSAAPPEAFQNWDATRAAHHYEEHAPALAAQALNAALAQCALPAQALDALILCSCTGNLTPGASTYVAETVAARADIHLADLTGFGCAAAIPTLHQACAFLSLHPEALAAVIAVELCSATFFLDNDPAQLVSQCLFGDGAAALILCGEAHPLKSQSLGQFSQFQSYLNPQEREKIRLAPAPEGLLRNQLDPAVPQLSAQAAKQLWEQQREKTPELEHYPILSHGGGRKVIEALEATFPNQSFQESKETLRKHGNLSSASLYFSLEQALKTKAQASNYWLVGFGAGFSAHSCLLTTKNTKSTKGLKKTEPQRQGRAQFPDKPLAGYHHRAKASPKAQFSLPKQANTS